LLLIGKKGFQRAESGHADSLAPPLPLEVDRSAPEHFLREALADVESKSVSCGRITGRLEAVKADGTRVEEGAQVLIDGKRPGATSGRPLTA
jgi:hypothetical protein